MDIILLQDVKALGKKDQIVKVNDSYARNYILPKKLGLEATGKNLNDVKLKKANDEKVAKEILEKAKQLSEKLAESKVELAIKTGQGGKLFGSLSTKEIAKALKDQIDLDVDKKKIILAEPIKSVGIHEVRIKLHKKVTAKLDVHVKEL